MTYIRKERRSFETISQSEYDRKSDIALKNQPIRKEVPLSSIEVVKDGVLSYGGSLIGLSENALKDICKIVGFPLTFEKTFTKNFGEDARRQMLSKLKTATALNKSATVTLLLNPETKMVVAVHKTKHRLISHSAFLDTTTSLIDQYNLDVNNFTVNSDGSLIINASSPQNQFGIQGLKDEDFFGGITFSNEIQRGFEVSPFLHRILCGNGMIGGGFEETLRLGGLDPKMSEDFFVQLKQMGDRGFKPMGLESRIKTAIETPASLYEMRNAHESLTAYSGVDTGALEQWIPYATTNERFRGAKMDPLLYSDEQKKRAKTGTSIWDMINGMTHFASHDNGMRLSDESRRKLQKEAGLLLTKKVYDMQNTVPSPY